MKTLPPPWANVEPTGPLLRPDEAAAYLGIGRTAYYDNVKRGLVPKPLQIFTQATGVPRAWLDAIIAAHAAEGGGNG